jgi:hypothetical protein
MDNQEASWQVVPMMGALLAGGVICWAHGYLLIQFVKWLFSLGKRTARRWPLRMSLEVRSSPPIIAQGGVHSSGSAQRWMLLARESWDDPGGRGPLPPPPRRPLPPSA